MDRDQKFKGSLCSLEKMRPFPSSFRFCTVSKLRTRLLYPIPLAHKHTIPVLSCTAPVITPEYEEQEQAAVSREELQVIEIGLYGVNANTIIVETKEMRRNGHNRLCQALETIPDARKRDYQKAIKCAPSIMEKESNAGAFMRSEN
jgi:hypothetical protein